MVVDPLNEMGARIQYLTKYGCLPIQIEPAPFKGGFANMKVTSAQAVSAMLLARPDLGSAAYYRTSWTGTRPYRAYGRGPRAPAEVFRLSLEFRPADEYNPRAPLPIPDRWKVPSDPSALAYPAAAWVLAGTHAWASFSGVCVNPTRTGFFELLRAFGADVRIESTMS